MSHTPTHPPKDKKKPSGTGRKATKAKSTKRAKRINIGY